MNIFVCEKMMVSMCVYVHITIPPIDHAPWLLGQGDILDQRTPASVKLYFNIQPLNGVIAPL